MYNPAPLSEVRSWHQGHQCGIKVNFIIDQVITDFLQNHTELKYCMNKSIRAACQIIRVTQLNTILQSNITVCLGSYSEHN